MGFVKIIVLALLFAAVWIVGRWLNQPRPDLRHRNAPRRVIAAEELTACPLCAAYVADGSPRCGRSDCPRPRRPTIRGGR
jgi:hypothetical protein